MLAIEAAAPTAAGRLAGPWWRELSRYQWFVLLVSFLGWLFDTFDQQLFILGRKPAITELLGTSPTDPRVDLYSGYAGSVFIIGWATGGLLFGILGDRIGRARVMLLTILVYSLCTGASALSFTVWQYCAWRFLTGIGIGGEFAVGVALVAEVMPDRARPHALGWLQMAAIVGNVTAALVTGALGMAEGQGMLGFSVWRVMFAIGALPALLALLIRSRLREPERWRAEVAEGHAKHGAGSVRELFGEPHWRRNAIVGMVLAFAGVVGLWSTGFIAVDFVRVIFRRTYEAQGLSVAAISGELTRLVSYVSLLTSLGGFLGIYAFTRVTTVIGRRPAFLGASLLAAATTAGTYLFLNDFVDLFWMIPLMGGCQLMLFGGYAIYFPEMFPTRLRSTGTSFCYNVGRFVAGAGPLAMGFLIHSAFCDTATPSHDELIWAWRLAGLVMSSVFLIGVAVLPFAPETKGLPLPD